VVRLAAATPLVSPCIMNACAAQTHNTLTTRGSGGYESIHALQLCEERAGWQEMQ